MTSEAASVIKDEAKASALLDARALGAPSQSPSYSRCLDNCPGKPSLQVTAGTRWVGEDAGRFQPPATRDSQLTPQVSRSCRPRRLSLA